MTGRQQNIYGLRYDFGLNVSSLTRFTLFTGILLCFAALKTGAQNYTAINGSPYIGSLSVHNNPGSIVNIPTKWDLTLFGIQEKHSTNITRIQNYSLISNPANSAYLFPDGKYARNGHVNLNVNLLNTRIAINRRNAIAFGANIKSYTTVKSSTYNFVDTLKVFDDFFEQNPNASEFLATMRTSSWMEFYASYARTLIETSSAKLNAGATLKLNRGLSGSYLNFGNGSFTSNLTPVGGAYRLDAATIDLGYSRTYDAGGIEKNETWSTKNFIAASKPSLSFDLGAEYIISSGGMPDENEASTYFDYDWKFGVSLLDLGTTKYEYGRYSLNAKNLRADITGALLDSAFDSDANTVAAVHDSIAGLYTDAFTPAGTFNITRPARMVLNADHYLGNNLWINADLSISLANATNNSKPAVKDLNLFTITPRYETRRIGFYLPISYNNINQLWVGGAARLGPLLLGFHNLGNIVSKNKMAKGGFYLALIIKPSKITSNAFKADKRLDCPPL